MVGTVNTIENADQHFVLGETLRPLLTNAMGSSVEIFDTSGPADSGPPPHQHPWEEIYVVLSGELEVVVGGGEPQTLKAGSVAHVPAGTIHRYRNITECHFLTITTAGNAAIFFKEVSDTVEMSPPDVPAIVRAGNRYGIDFVL